MRKTISIILVSVFLFCICGCMPSKSEFIQPVSFYYCNHPITFYGDNDVIVMETREADGVDNLSALVNLYLKGPKSEAYNTPFPEFTFVRELSQNGTALSIMLSSPFANLTGMELTLACACLSMTLFELTDAESVEITAFESTLDGAESIIMTRNNLTLTDSYTPPTESFSQPEE